eukprot:TRINITY_DN5391_c0_g5_i1.p1 TRINITY_DN5391_c0_g5~~TRINITY_DN5391_c0_g5_i1.p1  ORF type:complete len:218 (-),score=38.00 TRINITY_DN5391_c0_g5_i1:321-974(-)
MSKPLATRLHEAFATHGALQLPADHFLIILRNLGATVSAKEGRALVKQFRKDQEGHVDVQKFCEWFTGMEQEPRFSQSSPTMAAPWALENHGANDPMTSGEVCDQPSNTNEAPNARFQEGPGPYQDEVDLDDDGAVAEREEGRVAALEEARHSVNFSRQVTADDDSVWSLGSEDKCTLQSHRRLTEREQLLADFRAALNDVNARLRAGPITLQPDLR